MTRYAVARANRLVLFGLAGVLALLGGVAWEQFVETRSAREWTQHSYHVLSTIRALAVAVRDAETGQRGYLLTGDSTYLAPYETALGRMSLLQGELQHLTTDNAAQQERLRTLAPILQHKLEELAQAIQLRRSDGLEAALKIVHANTGRDLMNQIATNLTAMREEEQELLAQRTETTDRRGDIVRMLVMSGAGFAILALIWAAWLLNQS